MKNINSEKIIWILISLITETILFGMAILLFSHEKYIFIGERIVPILISLWAVSGLITSLIIWFDGLKIFERIKPCNGA